MLYHPDRPLDDLVAGYRLCARSEGKSPVSIEIVTSSVSYFIRFLTDQGEIPSAGSIARDHIRAYILHLNQRRCFQDHPLIPSQDRGLSPVTINGYLRGLRIFFSWLVAEEVIAHHPFDQVKLPRLPRYIIPTFNESQLRSLLGAIDPSLSTGYRDHAIIIVLLDTGLRVSELTGLKVEDVYHEDGMLRVWGKGSKERLVPVGKQAGRYLWRYITHHRAEPFTPLVSQVFLTKEGRPMQRRRVQSMMTRYGQKAGLVGVRCSPHTLRHTAAVTFLRHGGNLFALQRILGHSQLDMTRRYCELADMDVKRAHRVASPADNLSLGLR
ncbi:MAG: tyrosine-type recombinase/integrase [Deltaproteobacteria bacterium]|nr:tyrosine-type recombinase/integrase [Deltaproteobacteria bacterium]